MGLVAFNGSYLSRRPTGIGVVAQELACALEPSQFLLLDPIGVGPVGAIPIPDVLGPQWGRRGHWRRMCWTQFTLPTLMRSNGADLLLSPVPEAPLWQGVRSVVLMHDCLPLRFPRPSPLLAYHLAYLPWVLHQAQLVLCNSLCTAKEVHQKFRVPHHKLHPITLGLNHRNFYPLHIQREPFFLVLGRHDPHKNLPGVLRAFALFPRREFRLHLIGPFHISHTPKLKRLARELRIDDRCEWKPWVSDRQRLDLLNRCQALLIPSLWEGFGLPALEAMACGTPVIASSHGALPEVVADAGLLVNPRSTVELVNAMTRIASESQLSSELAGRGVMRAAQFSWDTTATQIQQLINTLL